MPPRSHTTTPPITSPKNNTTLNAVPDHPRNVDLSVIRLPTIICRKSLDVTAPCRAGRTHTKTHTHSTQLALPTEPAYPTTVGYADHGKHIPITTKLGLDGSRAAISAF
nr:hypothetical protein L203_02964 [Cryptococcus depauperatus CBS 7841]